MHNHIKITAKLQNNHHSELSEIELNESLITIELKKAHPSRLVKGMEKWNRLVPHTHVVDKNSGRKTQERERGRQGLCIRLSSISGPPSLGFQCQEDNFWLQKPMEIEFVEETTRFPSSLLNGPHMDLLRLAHSELQHWGSSLKGTSGIQGGTEVSGVKVGAGGELSPRQKGGQRPLSLF